MTICKTALIASTALALAATPLLATTSTYTYDASDTLAGEADMVTVIGAIEGDDIVTNDGVVLGQIETFKVNEEGRAHIQVDLESDLLFEGDTMDLTIDPANVTVFDGAIALNASEEDLFAVRNGGAGAVKVDF